MISVIFTVDVLSNVLKNRDRVSQPEKPGLGLAYNMTWIIDEVRWPW